MNFSGMLGPMANAGGLSKPGGSLSEEEMQMQQYTKGIIAAQESCIGKTALAGVGGFAIGGAFGLFMSSMRYDTPLSIQGQEVAKLTTRQQIKQGFRDMGKQSFSSAKNFSMIGAIFAGTECCIEGFRGKNDLSNSVASGCITGAAIAHKGGPQAAAVGCAGFAAFSLAIDYYMRMPGDS